MIASLPHRFDLITLDAVDSTNTYAKAYAHENPQADRVVIRAVTQTAGRGRHGNAWMSLAGNLFMSLLLRTALPAADMGQLSFLAAVALRRTLGDYGIDARLKWPNDVLVGGRKIAGILLETETGDKNASGWVVVGVGVNVAFAPEGAVCMAALGAAGIAPEDVMTNLVHHILGLYDNLMIQGFADVRAQWLAGATGLGGPVVVRTARESYGGVFGGIDTSGALILELPDGGRKMVASGEVFFNE